MGKIEKFVIQMGGGLGFLNKKPWHPGSYRNMEKVAKREKEVEIQKKKINDRANELKLERENEELIRLGMSSGTLSKRDISLDWIYAGGLTTKTKIESSEESRINNANDSNIVHEQQIAKCPYPTIPNSELSNSESWCHSVYDPPVTILHHEYAQQQTVTANPVSIQQLKREIELHDI